MFHSEPLSCFSYEIKKEKKDFRFKRIKLQNPIKPEKGSEQRSTYIPGECANVAGIPKGSVSFVLSVIIINTRFQLVHATF